MKHVSIVLLIVMVSLSSYAIGEEKEMAKESESASFQPKPLGGDELEGVGEPNGKGTTMMWTIERIINFPKDRLWGQGYVHYGFHDRHGNRYSFDYFNNWIGKLGEGDAFLWTAGAKADVQTGFHMNADFNGPIFLTEQPDGRLLVSCAGNASLFELDPEAREARLFIDGRGLGMKDISSCILDTYGHMWISEITGCKIWCLDSDGQVILTIGDGQLGFQAETVPMDQARFGWIYVMQRGPDGHLYILDSTNYAVRRLNIKTQLVETLVGTGKPGYSGDGGDAKEATLGGDPNEQFDGPYGLRVDELGNLFIADTYNHVIRMVDKSTGVISTIAGQHKSVPHKRNDPNETDPFRVNLPQAVALDYFGDRLFIPEGEGDLIVLKKIKKIGVNLNRKPVKED